MNRLTTKIIFSFVIIAFIVVNLYITSSSTIFKNQYTKSFDSSVEQHNLSITEFLSSFENAIEMLSKNEMVQYISDHPEKYYESTLELFRIFQQSYASTAFAYFAPKEKIGGRKKLVSWPDTSEELSSSEWTAEKRPWYINAIKAKGKIAWTEPYMDATTKKYTISVSKEVRDRENNFKGVIAIDLYLHDVLKKINYFKEFNEGHLLIISENGNECFFIVDDNENEEFKHLFTDNLIGRLYEKKAGSFYVNNKLGSYYITFTTNRVTGWKVIGIIEQNSLNQGARDITQNIFFGVIAIVCMGIASILFVTKQMGSTIQSLSSSIKPTEEEILTSADEKIRLFEFEKEEIIGERENTSMNILFEIEGEKEKINKMIKNGENFNFLDMHELKISINRLIEYLNHLDPNLKSHEIQKESVMNLFIEIQEMLRNRKAQMSTYEDEHIFAEIDEIIDSILVCSR